MGKILIAVIAVFLLLGGFSGQIIEGIHGLRIDSATQGFVVATGAGGTSANVTLTGDLFQANIGEVTSLTSSNVTDTPIATTYTEATNVLLVTGLASSISRTLTVVYNAETSDPVWSAIGPFMVMLVIGGLAGLILWGAFKHSQGRR